MTKNPFVYFSQKHPTSVVIYTPKNPTGKYACKEYVKKKTIDLQKGKKSERQMKKLLSEKFNCDLNFTTDPFHPFDYIDNDKKIAVELKTRNIKFGIYHTLYIAQRKVNEGFKLIEKGFDIYMVWKCNNKTAYYKLTKETYKKEWTKKGKLARYDRGVKEYSDICEIPITQMKTF